MQLLEWLGFLTSADDLVKGLIAFVTAIFGGSKIWDAWQKRNDNETKVKEAQINANKEIQNNKDKHNSELERLKATINHYESEIRYKDDIIKEYKGKNESKEKRIEDLIKINDQKDAETIRLHERLLECERRK
jgi:hypothetical protein